MKNRIDYKKIIEKHSWLVKRGKNCVLSPDIDGLLCGLLMSHYLNWNIDDFNAYTFTKIIDDKNSKSNEKFLKIWDENPLSLAITGGATIQYTIEFPDKLSQNNFPFLFTSCFILFLTKSQYSFEISIPT